MMTQSKEGMSRGAKVSEDKRERLLECVVQSGVYTSRHNLRQHCRFMFDGIPLEGLQVLDVGGGTGLLTLWAAASGSNVVCLEPEADGSTAGFQRLFAALKSCAGGSLNARMLSQTLQEYLQTCETKLDLVMMANTINHLDEEHCAQLHKHAAARENYLRILSRVYDSMTPGGTVVITDCCRRNFFNDVGLRSPFMPSIEWEKHQSPRLWDELLQAVGFEKATIQWSAPNSLGQIGRRVLGNAVIAYFLLSHFRLVARKPINAAS